MDKSTRKWVTILLGVFLALGVCVVVAVGSAVYYIRSHVQSESVSRTTAGERFMQERRRFAGTEPLLEPGDRGRDLIVHRADASAARQPIQRIRVLHYDSDEERLTDVTIPFGVVRWMRSDRGRFRMRSANVDLDWDQSDLTIEDLERHGPGLILDREERNGSNTLIWLE